MEEVLADVMEATRRAGRAIMKVRVRGFTSEKKSDNSPVTEADTLSDKIIRESLSKYHWPFLSEEKTGGPREELGQRRVLVVQPPGRIDGRPGRVTEPFLVGRPRPEIDPLVPGDPVVAQGEADGGAAGNGQDQRQKNGAVEKPVVRQSGLAPP